MDYNEKFDHNAIEQKWQKIWDDAHCFEAKNDYTMKKFYPLIEFPFPSGAGLHVGHPRPYTAMDIIARKRRMEGYNVLFPIGYDSFGLPTENYAIKNHMHPAVVTKKNIETFRGQLKRLGLSFDWSREISTSDPEYFKWTQWIFLKLYEHGLAYKAEIPINFCTSCKVGLSNEEVVDGVCERCGSPVVRKVKNQWILKITDYAQKLLDGLDEVDFIDRVKTSQRNWIGKSTGAEIVFKVNGYNDGLKIYTTRPDTLFGATYMVISPEHPIIDTLSDKVTNIDQIRAYQQQAARKSDLERSQLSKEKTGVELGGITAQNPATGKDIPIWISDYVLMSYGTGAIMSVPAHDTRDYEFAKVFNLPIIEVVEGGDITKEAYTDCETGKLINSGFLNGLSVEEGKKKMIEWLTEQKIGCEKVNYKLRDWVFSRQRFWGEPIPLVHCDKCGWVEIPENELPLLLPDVEHYEPTDDGSSPISKCTDWVNTTCPHCGGPAQRETDTMPNWAGSSAYFLRYCDPHNDNAIASKEALDYWMPVNWYNGGMEHTTLHLLYSRFWHRFLYDIGVVSTPEPYLKRTSHGLVLAEDGRKMSKSYGNVVNPDDVINSIGADALRMYIMFMGAFDQPIPWSTSGSVGCRKFLERVWRLQGKISDEKGIRDCMKASINAAIKKVSEDFERLKFNTAVAAMMSLVNDIYEKGSITRDEFRILLLLLNPVSPHIAEEINEALGFKPLYKSEWPTWDESALINDTKQMAVQVNGKIRAQIVVSADASNADIEALALDEEKVKQYTDGKTIRKIIVVKNIVNIVVS